MRRLVAGWLGEAEGLMISLAGAEDKLAQIDRHAGTATVDLGMSPASGHCHRRRPEC